MDGADPAGARVVGLDIAEPFIRAATGHGGGHDSRRIRYVLGDGCVLPFGASVFDGVTAFMSLMDVAVPEQALHEMAKGQRGGRGRAAGGRRYPGRPALPDHRGQDTLRHPRLGRLPVDCAVDEAVDKRAALGRTEAGLWMNCG